MSKQVRIIFEDGERAQGYVNLDGENTEIIVGGMPYDVESFVATGATIAVNDQETLKALQALGIKARPTSKQVTITISVAENFKERLTDAAKETGRTVTSILVEAGEEWLKSQGM